MLAGGFPVGLLISRVLADLRFMGSRQQPRLICFGNQTVPYNGRPPLKRTSMIRRLHVPLLKPEDVIPHLAKSGHWKSGHSAQELAIAWSQSSTDFPPAVRAVLSMVPEYSDAELVDGFFEREIELGSPGRNSQADILVLAGLRQEIGIIAVEGKVNETFREFVKDWNTTPGKQVRLERLTQTLGLETADVGGIRYQLLHRTASAIYEAKRYRCRHAMMLVHSFSPTHRWFEDFAKFSSLMNQPVSAPGSVSIAKTCEGISLRLAWVADSPRGRYKERERLDLSFSAPEPSDL